MVPITPEHRARHLTRPLLALRVEELKRVLRDFSSLFGGLRQTKGTKAVLVARIESIVETRLANNETNRILPALRIMNRHSPLSQWVYHNQTVYNMRMLSQEEKSRIPQSALQATRPEPISPADSLRVQASQYTNRPSSQRPISQQGSPPTAPPIAYAPNVHFIPNEFYRPLVRVTTPLICYESYTGARKRVIKFKLIQEHQDILAKPHHELRLTCGVLKKSYNLHQVVPLEYPPVCELLVNGQRVGIPGIRGSISKLPAAVNPPNITKLCKINGDNTIDVTYGCAVQKYAIAVEIVEHKSVPMLVQEMRESRLLLKQQVIQQYQQQRQDADIVLEAEMLSLKCPLGFTRITAPCRSRSCRHMQCFEATTFLSMNEQTPTWTCPVCNRKINSIQDLVIDGYFDDILSTVGEDVQSVRIDPDGQLQLLEDNNTDAKSFETSVRDTSESAVIILDDDDDEVDTTPAQEPGIGDKRPHEDDVAIDSATRQRTDVHPQVIDLTLSDDEEEVDAAQGQQQQQQQQQQQPLTTMPPSSSSTTQTLITLHLPAPGTAI